MRGKFIVFEGGEGAGKDTQIDLLREPLKDVAVFTREPGGTALGKELRKILLDGGDVAVTTEALLFLADRAQHMHEFVLPNLEAGKHVISNRSFYSLVAYQVYGRDRHDLRPLIDAAHQLIYKESWPDMVFYLDLDPQEGLKRAEMRGGMNRIDRAPLKVHERIRRGFTEQLAGKPHVIRIDASQSIEAIHQGILENIESMI